jgi:hypothetical protein
LPGFASWHAPVRCSLIEAAAFRRRALEALDYLATDPSPVEFNIEEASELIRDARQ